MGTWVLEVGKMALYMSFPVALFHYFNQPAYFEQWVTSTKRQILPPEDPQNKRDIQQLVQDLRRRQADRMD